MNVIKGICEVILENKNTIIHNELIQEIKESGKELKLIVANDLWDELKVGFKGNLIIKYKITNLDSELDEYKLVKFKVKLKDIISESSNNCDTLKGAIYVFKKLY